VRAACFITSHGMGHATRACAVMQALHSLDASLEFEVYSKVPFWIFEDSLRMPFQLRPVLTDIGLVQRTPLEEDLTKTLRQLGMLMPYQPELVRRLAGQVHGAGCQFVLCDIAPLGILVAREAGIPSVLVENFRWDWIYAGYTAEAPDFIEYIDYMTQLFSSTDIYIQTEPVCQPHSFRALLAPPISREPRVPAEDLRHLLDISPDSKIILISTNGLLDVQALCRKARQFHTPSGKDLFLLFPVEGRELVRYANAVCLPRSFYHPDLVRLSDAVVAKAGYSTLAEAYHAGVLYAYIPRRRFRESLVLGEFIERRMGGIAIDPDLENMSWLEALVERLDEYAPVPERENGALPVAQFILSKFN
jgi:hypothetical protein